jgi:hypothetical protein
MYSRCAEIARHNTFTSQIDPELTWMLAPPEAFSPRLIVRVCSIKGDIERKIIAILKTIQAGELPPPGMSD